MSPGGGHSCPQGGDTDVAPIRSTNSTNTKVTKELKDLSEASASDDPTTSDAAFYAFWDAYPRKASKADARKAWDKIKEKDAGYDERVAGAARYRDDPNREAQFTKLPGTWLRAGCWDDEPLPGKVTPMPSRRDQNFDGWLDIRDELAGTVPTQRNQGAIAG